MTRFRVFATAEIDADNPKDAIARIEASIEQYGELQNWNAIATVCGVTVEHGLYKTICRYQSVECTPGYTVKVFVPEDSIGMCAFHFDQDERAKYGSTY